MVFVCFYNGHANRCEVVSHYQCQALRLVKKLEMEADQVKTILEEERREGKTVPLRYGDLNAQVETQDTSPAPFSNNLLGI